MPAHPCATNIFISGGVGITPFISVVRDLALAGRTNYMLHWSTLGEASLIGILEHAQSAGRVRHHNMLVKARLSLHAILDSAGEDSHAVCCGPVGWCMRSTRPLKTGPTTSSMSRGSLRPNRPLIWRPSPTPSCWPGAGRKPRYTRRLACSQPGFTGCRDLVSCEGRMSGGCRTPWLDGPSAPRPLLHPIEREKELAAWLDVPAPRVVLDI